MQLRSRTVAQPAVEKVVRSPAPRSPRVDRRRKKKDEVPKQQERTETVEPADKADNVEAEVSFKNTSGAKDAQDKPETTPTTEPQPQAAAKPGPQTETNPEPQTATEPEPEKAIDAEPQTATEQEPQTATEPESQTEPAVVEIGSEEEEQEVAAGQSEDAEAAEQKAGESSHEAVEPDTEKENPNEYKEQDAVGTIDVSLDRSEEVGEDEQSKEEHEVEVDEGDDNDEENGIDADGDKNADNDQEKEDYDKMEVDAELNDRMEVQVDELIEHMPLTNAAKRRKRKRKSRSSVVEVEVAITNGNHTQSNETEKRPLEKVKVAKEFKNHRLPLTCICIDSSDEHVFTASKDGSIIKWCLSTKRILKKVNAIKQKEAQASKKLGERHHVNHINAIAISDDSKFLATGGWDKKVRVWSPESLQWLHTFTLHRQEITALAFRRGHHMLYSGSADRSVMLWTLEDDENRCFVESLIGHESAITSMDTTRKERVLTSGGRDQSIRIWKIVEQAQTVFQSKHQSADVAKYINDQLFVSGGEDGNLTLWTTMKRSALCSVEAHGKDERSNLSHWITSLATFHVKQAKHTTKSKASGGGGNPSKRRKMDDDALEECEEETGDDDENEDENHANVDNGEQSARVEALIASGSCDSRLHIWKLVKNNLELHQTIECPGYINDLKFTSDGSRIVTACGKEHRFGRWTVAKGVKNCWRVFEVNKL